MRKFYAVKKGRKTGIFMSWEECEEQVKGFSNAMFKSFTREEEAKAYLYDEPKIKNDEFGLIAYVDGSYNSKSKEYGYGCVLLEGGQVKARLSGKDNLSDYVSMRNVAGEILGSLKAIEYAIKHEYPLICIYYDYEGIAKWANKEWKANKKGTIEYQNLISKYRNKIKISFVKVLAHSGDYYNEQADKLAKKAVGIH